MPAPEASAAPHGLPLDLVRDIWRAGEKLVRGNKLYGLGHPNTRTFVTELSGRFKAWFDTRGPLEVTLTSSEVLLDGEKALRGEGAERNFAHPLAEAGVTRLCFEPGLTPSELERFFGLLMPAAGTGAEELTTHLWTERLAHVHWTLDSELDRVDPKDEATAHWLKAALALIERARAESVERTPPRAPDPAQLSRDGLVDLKGVPPLPWDKVKITREQLAALTAEARADAELAVRGLGHLLEGRSPTEAELKLASELVVPALDRLASSGEVDEAERLLKLLDGGAVDEDTRNQLLAPAADKLARGCLVAVRDAGASAETAIRVVRRLGPAAAPAVVDAVGELAKGPVRQELVELLPDLGDPGLAALTDRLAGLAEEPARELLEAVAQKRGPLTIDLWDAARQHPAPTIAALGARRASNQYTLSPRRAMAQLSSPEPRTRMAAVAFLHKSGARSAAPAIDALAGEDSFKDLSLDQKKELLAALASLDPALGVSAARRLFSQKALLRGQAHEETRLAAAVTLGLLGDQQSRGELQAAATGKGVGPFRDACMQALRQLDAAAGRRKP